MALTEVDESADCAVLALLGPREELLLLRTLVLEAILGDKSAESAVLEVEDNNGELIDATVRYLET